jgi:selenium metabolism protein YedF
LSLDEGYWYVPNVQFAHTGAWWNDFFPLKRCDPSGPPPACASGGFWFFSVNMAQQSNIQEDMMTLSASDTVILVTRKGMGEAEPALQQKLIQTYLKLLDESNILPAAICFYTDGVKLAVKGSPVIDILRSLEKKGVRLILCSTCLGYFNLTDQVQVGIVGGMTDIIEAQFISQKVISI